MLFEIVQGFALSFLLLLLTLLSLTWQLQESLDQQVSFQLHLGLFSGQSSRYLNQTLASSRCLHRCRQCPRNLSQSLIASSAQGEHGLRDRARELLLDLHYYPELREGGEQQI